ncbi:MAG: hypothetical protein U5L06_05660 [Rhodovibrio sp.]|nr:hypothetical protein [Rhodovibrio sp.]
MISKKLSLWLATACVAASLATAAEAGPFILDHTDADDHGSANATENLAGWLYMQRVLENLESGVTNGNTTVVSLGATNTGSSGAYAAAKSAFDLSSLPVNGWTFVNVDGATALTDFFNGTGTTTINNAGILMMDSSSNVFGGRTSAENAVIDGQGSVIDTFLGNGGALHSQDSTYGWVTSLIPGITFDNAGGSGLSLTAAGSAAFPGLTSADLSAGPFHGRWTGGLGGLTTLFTETSTGDVVGIGSSGGSITNPNPPQVPVPPSIALMLAGLAALVGFGTRMRRRGA